MKKRKSLFFIGNFQLLQFMSVIIFTMYHIFWITVIFEDGIVELIKRSANSGGTFRIRELFEFSDSYLLLLMKPINFWLFKLPNGKSIVIEERQYHGSLQPCKYL